MVSRIPFQTKYGQDYVAVKNEVVDEVVREEGLLPGPDLYAWFRRFPERLHDVNEKAFRIGRAKA